MAADDPVIIEREGPLLILTLNRPKRMNAFTGSMLLLLTDAYAEADTQRRDPLHHHHGCRRQFLLGRRSAGHGR